MRIPCFYVKVCISRSIPHSSAFPVLYSIESCLSRESRNLVFEILQWYFFKAIGGCRVVGWGLRAEVEGNFNESCQKWAIPGNLFQVFEAESCHWCSLMTTNAKKFAFGCTFLEPYGNYKFKVLNRKLHLISTFYPNILCPRLSEKFKKVQNNVYKCRKRPRNTISRKYWAIPIFPDNLGQNIW